MFVHARIFATESGCQLGNGDRVWKQVLVLSGLARTDETTGKVLMKDGSLRPHRHDLRRSTATFDGRSRDRASHHRKRLSVQRLLDKWGPDASLRDIMHEQIGNCPHRNDAQIYTRCDPYCPTLVELFAPPEAR